jgi:hypothetical protein
MLKITQVELPKRSLLFENEMKNSKFLEYIPSSPSPDIAPWRSFILKFLTENGTITNFAYTSRPNKKKVIRTAIEVNRKMLDFELRSDYIYVIANEELEKVQQKYLVLEEFVGWKAIKILDGR